MTPAEVVIDVFGGVRATAKAAELAPSTVCRWMQPRKRGGTGGLVPQAHFQALQDAAHLIGKIITIEHLVIGKPGITSTLKRGVQGRAEAGAAQKWRARATADKPLDPVSWMTDDLLRLVSA